MTAGAASGRSPVRVGHARPLRPPGNPVRRRCRLSIARGGLWRALAAQKALAAEYRPALSQLEGYRGLPAALGACGRGLRLARSPGRTTLALILAVLAPFGFVLEVLVVEEVLFSRREYEFCSAVYALEAAILEIRHNSLSPVST